MTDRRLGTTMPEIIASMPPRSAIVIRTYALSEPGDGTAIRRMIRIARARRHWVVLARARGDHRSFSIDALHISSRTGGSDRRWPCVFAVHNPREARRARLGRAAAVLISPIWTTRSHPDAMPLGMTGLTRLMAGAGAPVIVLGGADGARFRQARRHGAIGWAAIDAWLVRGGKNGG